MKIKDLAVCLYGIYGNDTAEQKKTLAPVDVYYSQKSI
jgi:hypothetical protein